MLKHMTGLAAALIGLSLCVCTTAEAKGFRHLSFNGGYAISHPSVEYVWKGFMDEAEKKFPGKNGLSFDYFATNELFPEMEGIMAVADGRVDFGRVRPSLFPGKMNLLSVVDVPGLFSNAITGSVVMQELIEAFPEVQKELPPNSQCFTSWVSATYQVHTIKPVKSLAELKGHKLVVWDAVTIEIAKALGANPIRLPSPDTYLALSKGMADGVLCPMAPVRSFKISEATKYHLMLNTGVTGFNISIHKPLWDEMPADMQTWLREKGGVNMALALGKSLEDGAREDAEWMRQQGHEFYELSDADHAALMKALSPFLDHWKNEVCKDESPELVEKVLNFVQERNKFHMEELRAGKYGKYDL